MNKKIKNIIIFAAVILVIIIAGWFWYSKESAPGKLDEFAKCLKDKGLIFYGAFWCPHCNDQKNMFSSSKKYLPYVECSTPDGNKQLPVCQRENIKSYPTWKFPDGSKEEGTLSLQRLSEKSGCPLP